MYHHSAIRIEIFGEYDPNCSNEDSIIVAVTLEAVLGSFEAETPLDSPIRLMENIGKIAMQRVIVQSFTSSQVSSGSL